MAERVEVSGGHLAQLRGQVAVLVMTVVTPRVYDSDVDTDSRSNGGSDRYIHIMTFDFEISS